MPLTAKVTRHSYFALCVCVTSLFSLWASAQTFVTNVIVGTSPQALAINSATNKIYVANQVSNNVTIIDGATLRTTTLAVGLGPDAIAVNPLTNKIYVANGLSGTVTVINAAANNQSSTLTVGTYPMAIAINTVTDQIYVANYNSNNVTVINGQTNHVSTVTVGSNPYAIAVDPATNNIFVADNGSNDVAIFNASTNSVTRVPVESYPCALAVNSTSLSNQVYVANCGSTDVSVIDETTLTATSVPVGAQSSALAVDLVRGLVFAVSRSGNSVAVLSGTSLLTTLSNGATPVAVDLDPVTTKVYFAGLNYGATLTMVDEVSDATTSVDIFNEAGIYPSAVAVNPVTNTVYAIVANTVAVVSGGNSDPLQFVPVTPCRVVDTRQTTGQFGGPYLPAGTSRSFALPQNSLCGIPPAAAAYSLNVTAVPHGPTLNYLTVWPMGELQPYVSTLNSPDGRVKANAAIVPAGATGAVTVYVTDSADVILDINGYFEPPNPQLQELQFYPLPPCRVVDTRPGSQQPQGLGPPTFGNMETRPLPFLTSPCLQNLPQQPEAYALNITVVPSPPGQSLNYLTVWPSNKPQPYVSTLNNPKAIAVANAAMVPADPTTGDIDVFTFNSTDVIIDISGYFAAPASTGLSLYPLSPCRVIDTRSSGGAFSGERNPPVNVAASACGIASTAQAYVFNATVVPVGSLGFLTLWADGSAMPGVSTLNAGDGVITSNMAIVPNLDGETDAYALGTTQLILDIASYFAP